MKQIALVFSLLALAACSTYSKKECEVKDWYQEGYNSAREGNTLESINYFRANCTKEHGVAVNETLYTDGFNKGLQYLCTEQQGRMFGQSGRTYYGTCPKETEANFMKTYESGRMDFLVRKVGNLEEELQQLRNENSRLKSEVSDLNSKLDD